MSAMNNENTKTLAESSERRSTQQPIQFHPQQQHHHHHPPSLHPLSSPLHHPQSIISPGTVYYLHPPPNNNMNYTNDKVYYTHSLPTSNIMTPSPPPSTGPYRYDYPYNSSQNQQHVSYVPEYRASVSWACCCHYTGDFIAFSLVIGFLVFAGYICYYEMSNGGG
mmetsp:Transcript_30778/g.45907  ORF Transcript_30778/g.45907 Transcript_30778/m.45907 type:complete len:165 (-) Transcript_30778:461-955(-)